MTHIVNIITRQISLAYYHTTVTHIVSCLARHVICDFVQSTWFVYNQSCWCLLVYYNAVLRNKSSVIKSYSAVTTWQCFIYRATLCRARYWRSKFCPSELLVQFVPLPKCLKQKFATHCCRFAEQIKTFAMKFDFHITECLAEFFKLVSNRCRIFDKLYSPQMVVTTKYTMKKT